MMLWNFTLHPKGLDDISDELAESLYGDFSDGALTCSNRRVQIGFGREAASLNDAIRSAVADVRRHGLTVDHVEIEEHDLAETELARW